MKKTVLIVFTVFAVMLTSNGCKKEVTGPAGPAGPTGSTGASGSSIIIAIDTFTVPSSSWIQVSANYYKFIHTNSAITQEIVDKGTIQVFSKNSVYPDWTAWPDVVAGGGAGFRFSYNLNTLTLLGDYFTSGQPPTVTIKAVIMK